MPAQKMKYALPVEEVIEFLEFALQDQEVVRILTLEQKLDRMSNDEIEHNQEVLLRIIRNYIVENNKFSELPGSPLNYKSALKMSLVVVYAYLNGEIESIRGEEALRRLARSPSIIC